MADNDFMPAPINNGGAGSVQASGVRAVDYRQLQQPEEVDIRRIDQAATESGDAASKRAGELGNIFKQFEGFSNDMAARIAGQAGTQAGYAAGVAGNPEPKTGLAAITTYGSAYDAAAHVAYKNNVEQNAAQTLDRIEQDTPSDPVAFATRAQGVAEAAVNGVDPLYKAEVQQMYSQRIQAGITRLRGQVIEQQKSDALNSYLNTVDSRIDQAIQTSASLPVEQRDSVMSLLKANNQSQLDALVKAGAITQARADILAQKFGDSAVAAVHSAYTTNIVNHMMDLARSGDVDAADHALHQYLADPNNTDDDKAAITKAYLTKASEFTQAQSRIHANDIAALGQQLAQGKYGNDVEPTIHQLYKNGSLSPELLHSLMDQSMRNQVADIKDSADFEMVNRVVHGQAPKLDASDKGQISAADTYFKNHVMVTGVPPLSDTWVAGVTNFAKITNIVPPSAMSQIRIGLLSGDPNVAAQAAAAGERIRSANPQLNPYYKDARSAALANEINANLKAGLPAQQAVQYANQTINRDEGQRKIVDQNYRKLIQQNPDSNRKSLQSALDAATPGMFSHAPQAPVPLQAEYDRLVATYYGLNQNIDAARTMAAKQVQTTWGVSRMNGEPELVKYPPERLGVSGDMVRADVAQSAQAAGYTGDASQIHLTPNAYTDGSNGRVWTLTHVDPQSGLTDVLLGKDNQPLMYHVPVAGSQDFAKARQALIDQKLAAARALRDKQRQDAAERMQYEQQLADEYLQ